MYFLNQLVYPGVPPVYPAVYPQCTPGVPRCTPGVPLVYTEYTPGMYTPSIPWYTLVYPGIPSYTLL